MTSISKIKLTSNRAPLTVWALLAGKSRKELFEFGVGELLHDEDGWVRHISRLYDDGQHGNFHLLPRHQGWQVAEYMTKGLAAIGLAVAFGRLVTTKSQTVSNTGSFIVGSVGTGLVHNFFERMKIEDSAYYELTTNELVFAEPINIYRDQHR